MGHKNFHGGDRMYRFYSFEVILNYLRFFNRCICERSILLSSCWSSAIDASYTDISHGKSLQKFGIHENCSIVLGLLEKLSL